MFKIGGHVYLIGGQLCICTQFFQMVGRFEVGLSELKRDFAWTVENIRPPIGKVAPRSRR